MGFITGALVGAALAAGSGSSGAAPGVAIVSDTHDVIMCAQKTYNRNLVPNQCEGYFRNGKQIPYLSPGQFVIESGYKVLHKKGQYVSPDGRVYIIMEVSK